jgi:Rod binding domain-containing protein
MTADGIGLQTGMNAGHATAAAAPRLVRSAHEFEGQIMKELLEPLLAREGESGEDDDSGAGSTLSEFGAEALGRGLSQRGGFGIADRIIHDLSHSGKHAHGGKVTGNLHNNTGMSRAQ